MINHIRTLLLNGSASAPLFTIGEEFVPTDYEPRTLAGPAARVRGVLFGRTADRTLLNYRLWQYLRLLHASELREHLVADDPRITYTFRESPFLAPELYLPQYRQIEGAASEIRLLGPAGIPELSGCMRQAWQVQVFPAQIVGITPLHQYPQVQHTFEFSSENGWTKPIKIPDTQNNFFIFRDIGPGQSWIVSRYSQPTISLGSLRLVLAAESGLEEFFHAADHPGQQEPMKTYRNLFYDSTDDVLAIGGALLTLANWTEAA